MTDRVPAGWELWVDPLGHVFLLPSGLKVAQCQFCKLTITTKIKAFRFVAKLKALVAQGYLRYMAGTVMGRPCCSNCLFSRRVVCDGTT